MPRKPKRFVVIGLGQFGASVALRLLDHRCEVLAVDSDPERVQELSDRIPHVVSADATDEKVLSRLGVSEYDVAIISCGQSLEVSILATTVVRELGVPEIIAKANNDIHGNILHRLGATRVIYPEKEHAIHLANSLAHPDILQQISLSPDYALLEIESPEALVGKTIVESAVRSRYGISILAIRTYITTTDGKTEEKLLVTPDPSYTIQSDDSILVVGKTESIKKFAGGKT